jgi:hypothetical protein
LGHCLAQQLLLLAAMLLLAVLLQQLGLGCRLACTLARWACWVLAGPQGLLMA